MDKIKVDFKTLLIYVAIGVTGYVYYHWWTAFTAKDMVLLCALVLGCFLLYFIQEYIIKVYRCREEPTMPLSVGR